MVQPIIGETPTEILSFFFEGRKKPAILVAWLRLSYKERRPNHVQLDRA